MRGKVLLWEEVERKLDIDVRPTIFVVLSNEASTSKLTIHITL